MKISDTGLVVGEEVYKHEEDTQEIVLQDKEENGVSNKRQRNVLTPTPAAAEAAEQRERENARGYEEDSENEDNDDDGDSSSGSSTSTSESERDSEKEHDWEEEEEEEGDGSDDEEDSNIDDAGYYDDYDNDGGDEGREPDEEVKYEDIELKEVIGVGSSGYVRRAVHKRTGVEYALKIIKFVPSSESNEATKAGLVELHSLSKLNSQHVVKFYNAYFVNGEISILVEFMNAGTLKDLTKARPIPESILGRISEQILKGLAYLHKQHFIHRDIKPTNLLVNTKGQVKLADFGVSNRTEHTFSACNSMIGTVTYMSPERILAEPYKIDSDIWSFGLVVLECATGIYPYSRSYNPRHDSSSSASASSSSVASSASSESGCGSVAERISRTLTSSNITTLELMERIVNEPPPFAPDTSSSAFRSFVASCLQKTPTDRPTAASLLEHDWIKQCEAHGARVYAWVHSTLNLDFEF